MFGPTQCSICGTTAPRKSFNLYGYATCKKCFYRLANRRQIAFIIDGVLLRVVGVGLGLILASAVLAIAPGVQLSLVPFYAIDIVLLALFCCKDGFHGQSPGKWLTGVQVIDSRTGEPIGFVQSFKRNLVVLIPLMPLFLAYQMNKGPRMGDGWAKTKVIQKRYAELPVFSIGTKHDLADFLPMAFEMPVHLAHDDGNPYQSPSS